LLRGSIMNPSVDHRNEQPAELISGVLHDARDFAQAEVDKLKAEAITEAKEVREEVKVASVGLMILTVAAIMLGTALALGLVALGLPGWAGFGIIAIVFGVVGVTFLDKRHDLAKRASEAAKHAAAAKH